MEFLVHSHDDRSVGKVTTIKKGKIVWAIRKIMIL
jgi:hypothetical protein